MDTNHQLETRRPQRTPDPQANPQAAITKSLLLLLLLIAALSLPASAHPIAAQSFAPPPADPAPGNPSAPAASGWQTPFALSQAPNDYAFGPAAAFDVYGNVHVVWEQWQGREQETARIYYSTNRSGAWSAPTVVSGKMRPARVPALAADAAGNVHLIFAAGSRGATNDVYYAVLAPDGSWNGPALVQGTNRINGAARPTVITDAAGQAHLIWMHDHDKGYDIAARIHYPDGSWSERATLVKNPGYTDKPRGVALGPAGSQRLHVVMKLRKDGANGDKDVIAYTQGYGDQWSQPVELSISLPGRKRVYAPSIATDGWRLFVAWDNYPHDIHFAMSRDGGASWTPPTAVYEDPGVASAPSLTTVAGRLLMTWQLGEELLAREMDLGNEQWGPVIQVNQDYEGKNVVDSELVSGPGDRAVVVWQQRRAENGYFEVVLAEWRR